MKNKMTVTNPPPADMQEVSTTTEQLTKLAHTANELTFAIKSREKDIAEYRAHLADIRKQYASLKPKVLGVTAALEGA